MLVGLFFFSFRVLPIGSSTRSAASACSWYTLAHDSTCFKCPEDEADRIAAKVVTVFFLFFDDLWFWWRRLTVTSFPETRRNKKVIWVRYSHYLYLMANCLERKTKYSRKSTLFVLFFFLLLVFSDGITPHSWGSSSSREKGKSRRTKRRLAASLCYPSFSTIWWKVYPFQPPLLRTYLWRKKKIQMA